MWYNFLLLYNKPFFVNESAMFSLKLLGREALSYLLVGINKNLIDYYFLDVIKLQLIFNVSSLKNLYLPGIYMLETNYHAKIPVNFFFFTYRYVKFFSIVSFYKIFLLISLVFYLNIVFYSVYVYLHFFLRKKKRLLFFFCNYIYNFLHKKLIKKKFRKFKRLKRLKIRKMKRKLRMRLKFIQRF